MSTFSQLYSAMSVSGSDLIAVFTGNSQTTRRITVFQLAEYIAAQQLANESTMSTQYAAPGVNGFIVQILQPITGGPDVHMIINPLTGYATGTIQLPPFNTALDGQLAIITTTKSIGAVTIDLNGASAGFGLPTTLGTNDSLILAFDQPSASWYMIGRSVPSPATTDTAQTFTNKTLQSAVLIAPTINAPSFGAPVTKTAAFTLAATENMVVCSGVASIPVTLPAASSAPGRAVRIKNIAAFTVTSATANVVPLAGGAAGTAILPATAGASVLLVSDGTNWITMA